MLLVEACLAVLISLPSYLGSIARQAASHDKVSDVTLPAIISR